MFRGRGDIGRDLPAGANEVRLSQGSPVRLDDTAVLGEEFGPAVAVAEHPLGNPPEAVVDHGPALGVWKADLFDGPDLTRWRGFGPVKRQRVLLVGGIWLHGSGIEWGCNRHRRHAAGEHGRNGR